MKFHISYNSIALSLLACSMALTSCSTDDNDAPAADSGISFSLSARLADMTPARSGAAEEKIVIPSSDNDDFCLEITGTPASRNVSRSSCYTYVRDAKLFCYLWHNDEGWTGNLSPNLIYGYNAQFNSYTEPTLIKVTGEGQHKGLGLGFNIGVFGYSPQESPNAEPMAVTEKAYPYVTYMLPQDASQHEDFTLGFYNISEYLGGHHMMKFYHTLSAVKVQVHPDASHSENTNGTVKARYVAALRLTNLYIGGKCELEYETTRTGLITKGIKWSGLRRQPGLAIAADFSREEGLITEDGVTLSVGTPPETPNLYFNSTFMMVPQTTPAGADLCVIVNEEKAEGTGSSMVNQQTHFSMGNITFKPGYVYTLTVMKNRS